MQIEQHSWTSSNGWNPAAGHSLGSTAQLVFFFGSTALLRDPQHYTELRQRYPQAHIVGCSTSGEISGTTVSDDSLVSTAICFEATAIQAAKVQLHEASASLQAGQVLAGMIDHTQLTHVFVFSDGTQVNGSELVKGLSAALPTNVAITGGLAGDGPRFEQTLVCLDAPPESGAVAIIGLYGNQIQVGYGSVGGWDAFGPERRITRSRNNVLYELDGQSALELYKRYLGEYAADLPASGLLFPLNLREASRDTGIVRTILAISEADQSITFAGDMPEGMYVRLMKANVDSLVTGATQAAQASYTALGSQSPDLAILISCVGRKLVLKQRVEEEVESVRDILGEHTVMTGFYSYGEIAPFASSTSCELHNQTMTITTLSETKL